MLAEPKPPRTRPVVVLPGVTINRLVPRALMAELTEDAAPSPRPTVRITAAIPIRIPRMVSDERSLWLVIASIPERRVSNQLMPRVPAGPRTCRHESALSARPQRRHPARGL